MDRRTKSLRVMAALRKSELDKEAGKLVGLRGYHGQNMSMQQQNRHLADEAGRITDIDVIPYLTGFMTRLRLDIDQLHRDEAALREEIAKQQSLVNKAWQKQRVITTLQNRQQERRIAMENRAEQQMLDELSLICRSRNRPAAA